jgi:hypothetical protein
MKIEPGGTASYKVAAQGQKTNKKGVTVWFAKLVPDGHNGPKIYLSSSTEMMFDNKPVSIVVTQ